MLLRISIIEVPESRIEVDSGAKEGSAMVEVASAVVVSVVGSTGGRPDKNSASLGFPAISSGGGGGGEGVEVGLVLLGHSEKFREARDTCTKHDL